MVAVRLRINKPIYTETTVT